MTTNIKELSEKRQKWVKANRENGFENGIKRLLTEMYPDNAHFIYELLQNAEDAQATEVRFILQKDRVEFKHDGTRLFDINDIDSITSIGVSTKRDDPTNIGKFGVGFKAVFAYTSTPKITSGEYCFEIHDLVAPFAIESPDDSFDTRFVFPFDNPKKPPEQAYKEIEKSLRLLDEGTLLFLSNIKKIEYLLPDAPLGVLERKKPENYRIEISVKHPGDESPQSVYFLKFEKDVTVNDDEGKPKLCRVSIAFKLEKMQKQEKINSEKRKKHNKKEIPEWKIVPLSPGKVSIFFPADKETSNLKFHLHAPFASTVSRDSVRDCAANNELRDQIAELVSDSMSDIRDLGLLNVEFLSTLPNDKDKLSEFYLPIQTALVRAFQNDDLVPMKNGGHSAASGIYRNSANLSALINDDDLAMILGEDYFHPMWVANPSQENQREDNFLSMLNIREWDIEDLVDELSDSEVLERLFKGKSDQWHQQLYVMLKDFLSNPSSYPSWTEQGRKKKLSNLRLVRLSDGTYSIGNKCYFPSEGIEQDETLPRVAKGVYSSNKNKKKQEKARKFLEEIGVREVGETEQVEVILKQRYSCEPEFLNQKTYYKDLRRFIRLIEKKPNNASLFADYYIFKGDNDKWYKPRGTYLDLPFLDTGLKAYYTAVGEDNKKYALNKSYYEKSKIKLENIGKFAEAVGAITNLEVKETIIPRGHYLVKQSGGGWSDDYGINRDYTIKNISKLLYEPSLDKSKLIWRVMDDLDENYLHASYRNNSRYNCHKAPSTLVYDLRNAKWVPQKSGDNLSFVLPCEAAVDKLPKGFPYEAEKEWLKAIEFGKNAKQKKNRETQEYQNKKQAAETFGLEPEEAEKIAELKRRNPELFKQIIQQANQKPTFPEKRSSNPERRRKKLEEQMGDAPKKEYEQRNRSVRTTKGEIDPILWLRNQYTNDAGQMVCQICKEVMPFRKRDGKYYFEAVEALSRDHFAREHEAQFLALCPLCAAMYNEFVKHDEGAMESLKNALKNSGDAEVPLQLGELDTTVRFVESHFLDIRTSIETQE